MQPIERGARYEDPVFDALEQAHMNARIVVRYGNPALGPREIQLANN